LDHATASIASGTTPTLWPNGGLATDLGTGTDPGTALAALLWIGRCKRVRCDVHDPRRWHPAARGSDILHINVEEAANAPNPSQRTCRSARACAGWHTMSEAPADAPSEPVVWLSWPTICTRSRERSVV
jgi:hypothetical protein